MSAFDYKTVKVEKKDGIAWVTLNRPDKRNCMNPQLCFDMGDILRRLDTDTDFKVLVLTGAGEAFSAGMDLREFFRALDDKPVERAAAREADRFWNWHKLSNFSKPTIAMVNGYCFGGAFTPLVACDIAIAAEDATFGLSEVNWGILPGGLVSKVTTLTMNYRKSLYYAMTGRSFDGKTAAEIGLVTFAVPREKLRGEVVSLANDLMKLSPEVVRSTKETIKTVRDMGIEQAYEYIQAKSEQLRYRDTEGTRAKGLKGFLDDKTYKPGESAVPRG